MTVGLTIMRLQPLHKGHQKIIDIMLDENKKVILMIGSIDVSDDKNPYSYEERLSMVQSVYGNEIKTKKLFIGGLKDIHNRPKWADYVTQQLPFRADNYYCGQEQDGELFQEKGYIIKSFNRNILPISGTQIRQKIKNGDISWQQDVSSKIHALIQRKEI